MSEHPACLQTPVAFLVFNRPDCTARVLARIREARPSILLVVADGPRATKPGEEVLCHEVRKLIDEGIDWPCDVRKNYSDCNLGCRDRVVSGLNWVFDQVEMAVILEDDCLPEMDFFRYASSLLQHYQHDGRVFAISGSNFQPDQFTGGSFYFSKYPHIWGWATWRRVWTLYDVSLRDWPQTKTLIRQHLNNRAAFDTFSVLFDRCRARMVDTWDYQFCYACFLNRGLTVIPGRNLVKNIGFDARATHTTHTADSRSDLETFPMDFPLIFPGDVLANESADAYTVSSQFAVSSRLLPRMKNLILKCLRLIRTKNPLNIFV